MVEIFKNRLQEEMKAKAMSTKELSAMIGVSPEMVTQYYTTKKLPKLDTFVKICKALDVSADYLLGLTDF